MIENLKSLGYSILSRKKQTLEDKVSKSSLSVNPDGFDFTKVILDLDKQKPIEYERAIISLESVKEGEEHTLLSWRGWQEYFGRGYEHWLNFALFYQLLDWAFRNKEKPEALFIKNSFKQDYAFWLALGTRLKYDEGNDRVVHDIQGLEIEIDTFIPRAGRYVKISDAQISSYWKPFLKALTGAEDVSYMAEILEWATGRSCQIFTSSAKQAKRAAFACVFHNRFTIDCGADYNCTGRSRIVNPFNDEKNKQFEKRQKGLAEKIKAEVVKCRHISKLNLVKKKPLQEDSQKIPLLEGMYIATYNNENKGRIWLLEDEEIRLVAEIPYMISALCSHNDMLYAAGNNKVYCAMDDIRGEHPIVTRHDRIFALESHEGLLCDSGQHSCIFNTLEDPSGYNAILSRENRDLWITALCSHNGILYYASYDQVFAVRKDEKESQLVARRPTWIYALESHQGVLYDGGKYNRVFATLQDPYGLNPIKERQDSILALCSDKGELYDAGYYETVLSTLANKRVYEFNEIVTAMCSHRK